MSLFYLILKRYVLVSTESCLIGFFFFQHFQEVLLFSVLHAAAAAAKALQSCPTLCDPIDGSPPGSSIHGFSLDGVLEWGAIAFSELYPWKAPILITSTRNARII